MTHRTYCIDCNCSISLDTHPQQLCYCCLRARKQAVELAEIAATKAARVKAPCAHCGRMESLYKNTSLCIVCAIHAADRDAGIMHLGKHILVRDMLTGNVVIHFSPD